MFHEKHTMSQSADVHSLVINLLDVVVVVDVKSDSFLACRI